MLDKTLQFTFESLLNHIEVCEERFLKIACAEDFVATKDGTILLDSIVIRLQAIGEKIKKISKSNPEIILNHPDIEWDNIIKFRDFISHHYEMLDYEIVFHIGKVFLPKLKKAISVELKNGFK